MAEFKIESNFTPSGDQPQAIASITEAILANTKEQVLLGLLMAKEPVLYYTSASSKLFWSNGTGHFYARQ